MLISSAYWNQRFLEEKTRINFPSIAHTYQQHVRLRLPRISLWRDTSPVLVPRISFGVNIPIFHFLVLFSDFAQQKYSYNRRQEEHSPHWTYKGHVKDTIVRTFCISHVFIHKEQHMYFMKHSPNYLRFQNIAIKSSPGDRSAIN